MEDTKLITHFLDFAAVVVVGAWFIFTIRIFILYWKHDSYLKKVFPKLSKDESVSVFGGNWNSGRILRNVFSKSAPNEHLFLIRRKIRHAWLGALLSITLLPLMLLFLLVIIMASMRILGYSL